MKIHYKTTLGQDATIIGAHEKFLYGFIIDDDRGPDTILHMRWDVHGKAHGVTGKPILAVNWDLIL